MGRTIRTDRYRYVEWVSEEGEIKARELYDHDIDPGELTNRALVPAMSSVIQRLADRLEAGWRSALPD
jgi:hypothetical protein